MLSTGGRRGLSQLLRRVGADAAAPEYGFRDRTPAGSTLFLCSAMRRIGGRLFTRHPLPNLLAPSPPPSTLSHPLTFSALYSSPSQFNPTPALASLHSKCSSSSSSSVDSASWRAFRKEKDRRAAEAKVVEKICAILKKRGEWGVDTVNELEKMKIRLRSKLLNKVLRGLEDPDVAHSFFLWAGKQPSFSHSLQTYHAMMEIMGTAQRFDAQSELLQDMHRQGLQANTATFNILLLGFSRANFTDRLVETFKQMEHCRWSPNAFTFKCVIRSLVWNRRALEALAIYMKMMEFGYVPDNFTYNGLIEGLSQAGHVDEAFTIFQDMEDRGLNPDAIAHASLIKGLDSNGRVDEACRMFHEMTGKNLRTVVNTHKGVMGVFSKRHKGVMISSDAV